MTQPPKPPETTTNTSSHEAFVSRVVETAIRLGLLVLLASWCFQIMQPFLIPIVWGGIIAVASYPGYLWLGRRLGGRQVLAAILFTLLGLVVLIVPMVLLSATLVEGARGLAADFQAGTLRIPPPPEGIGTWPLIGPWVEGIWRQASQNLVAAIQSLEPQLKGVGTWLLSAVAGVGYGILEFIFALGIAGALLAHSGSVGRAAEAIARRLAGERGTDLAQLAEATVRSVTRGILGVAFIQAVLAGLGFLAVGVPGAGLLALVALLFSIIQLGIFPVVLPVLIYVFSHTDTGVAIAFLVWSLFVGTIDNVLKPILLGRGVAVPMLVIFVGAIGGFLSSGIIGLFVGSVVLVLGYKLFLAWLYEEEKTSLE